MSFVTSVFAPGPGVVACLSWNLSQGESPWRESWQLIVEPAAPMWQAGGMYIARRHPDGYVVLDYVLHLLVPPHGMPSYAPGPKGPTVYGLHETDYGAENGSPIVVCPPCLATIVPPVAWRRHEKKGVSDAGT